MITARPGDISAPGQGGFRLTDWGYLDTYAVIDHTLQNYPGQDIFFLGHSIAGQLFPLAANSSGIKAAFFVASQNASEKNWSGRFRILINFFWYVVVPFFVKLKGYLPGFAYGGRHSLHRKVATDWARWGKNDQGLLGIDINAYLRYSALASVPVKFLSFGDDRMIAPWKAVERLMISYGSFCKQHVHLTPADLGVRSVGHFGFFRRRFSHLWPEIDAWFNVIERSGSRRSGDQCIFF